MDKDEKKKVFSKESLESSFSSLVGNTKHNDFQKANQDLKAVSEPAKEKEGEEYDG